MYVYTYTYTYIHIWVQPSKYRKTTDTQFLVDHYNYLCGTGIQSGSELISLESNWGYSIYIV